MVDNQLETTLRAYWQNRIGTEFYNSMQSPDVIKKLLENFDKSKLWMSGILIDYAQGSNDKETLLVHASRMDEVETASIAHPDNLMKNAAMHAEYFLMNYEDVITSVAYNIPEWDEVSAFCSDAVELINDSTRMRNYLRVQDDLIKVFAIDTRNGTADPESINSFYASLRAFLPTPKDYVSHRKILTDQINSFKAASDAIPISSVDARMEKAANGVAAVYLHRLLLPPVLIFDHDIEGRLKEIYPAKPAKISN